MTLRFSDVLDELDLVAILASGEGGSAEALAIACLRLRALLEALRAQFLRDLGLADEPVAANRTGT